MNNKGFLFSVTAMVIAAMIIVVSVAKYNQDTTISSNTPDYLLSADAFLTQFEEDLSRAMHIIGYRGLIGLEEHVSTTGGFVDNVSFSYVEVMTNGTINGTAYDIMTDTTIDSFVGRIQSIAQQQGIILDFSVTDIDAWHSGPFTVSLNTSVIVNASTTDGLASWNYVTVITSEFSIENLKDPLNTVNTLGRVPIVVVESNVSSPYIDTANNTTGLQEVFNNSYYVPNTNAPTFLMRFTGNVSADPNGISRLVDTKELDDQDLTIYPTRTVVDYLYFNNSSATSYTIVNMESHVRIDDTNLVVYDAVGKTT